MNQNKLFTLIVDLNKDTTRNQQLEAEKELLILMENKDSLLSKSYGDLSNPDIQLKVYKKLLLNIFLKKGVLVSSIDPEKDIATLELVFDSE